MTTASQHLSDESLGRYRSRRMPPAELLASDDHLAVCDQCYARLQDDAELRAAAGSIDEAFTPPDILSDHLTYEQIAACVDEEPGEEAAGIAYEHLAICAACRRETRELISFRSLMAALPSGRSWPPRTTIGRKPSTVRSRPALRIGIPLAAAAAGLLVFGWAVTLPLRSRITRLTAQVDQLQQTKDSLEERLAAASGYQAVIADLRAQNEALKQQVDHPVPLVASLNDGGGRITLDKEGNLYGLPSLNPADEQAVKAAMTNQRLAIPAQIQRLIGHSGKLMGAGSGRSYGLLSPVGAAVETDKPAFRWNSVDGGATYVVSVYTDQLKPVATSPPLTTTEWSLPAPLQRGQVYIWQVRAVVDGKEVVLPPPAAPEARFKVLESAILAEVGQARISYHNSHLMLGIILARHGLLAESEREFQALLAANPQSPVARKLLQRLLATRPS